MDERIDVRGEAAEIDLRDRLRFAADSLATDFGDRLTADHAQALVFGSAEGLLATASVTEFVPILAERRARRAVRSGGGGGSRPGEARAAVDREPLAAPGEELTAEPEAPQGTSWVRAAPEAEPAGAGGSSRPALFAVPAGDMDRLRDRVDRVRVRVADWRAELDNR